MTETVGQLTAVSVVHEVGRALTVAVHGVELFRYTYRPVLPASECPCPYFHPLRSLAGDVVTGHRPHDHRWHKGLAMTATHLSGQNFWGGGTYTPGAPGNGYVDLPNVGRLEHTGFAEFAPGGRPEFTEHVDWVTAGGQRWIEEVRRFAVRDVDPTDGSWALEFATELRNVRGAALEFGSPTVFGRELAGYCGFFWRGPRSFTGGTVIAADGGGGPEMMGRRAGWLAYVGTHDEVDRSATLLFLAGGEPPHWFVRTTPYPGVNPSLAFSSARELPAGETLRLRYRMVVADAAWDRDRLSRYVKKHPW
ncbi:PmoA family protein [Gandjariella thermophila]|uniref:Oxidoreductase n=1 Tax=Gandjariella thermophila TaxID=1931992 RepID=A0A4D4JFH7_9PSEU|nr:PmoA family protein [Gandjariella thermophila]GDY33156.1 oxidoreductase [Gandjariella thermophila]